MSLYTAETLVVVRPDDMFAESSFLPYNYDTLLSQVEGRNTVQSYGALTSLLLFKDTVPLTNTLVRKQGTLYNMYSCRELLVMNILDTRDAINKAECSYGTRVLYCVSVDESRRITDGEIQLLMDCLPYGNRDIRVERNNAGGIRIIFSRAAYIYVISAILLMIRINMAEKILASIGKEPISISEKYFNIASFLLSDEEIKAKLPSNVFFYLAVFFIDFGLKRGINGWADYSVITNGPVMFATVSNQMKNLLFIQKVVKESKLEVKYIPQEYLFILNERSE